MFRRGDRVEMEADVGPPMVEDEAAVVPPAGRRVSRRLSAAAAFAGAAAVVGAVLLYGHVARPGWVGVSGKRFWDYLELLVVPAALALGVYALNRAQAHRERRAEDARLERELEVQNRGAQDDALQAYLDEMGQLLLDREAPLRKAAEDDEARVLAGARTLTVLARLDGDRKRSVVQFLQESGLISAGRSGGKRGVLKLAGADLRDANLTNLDLEDANLTKADLHEADLTNTAFGFNTKLRGANLHGRKTDVTLLNGQLDNAEGDHTTLLPETSGVPSMGAGLSRPGPRTRSCCSHSAGDLGPRRDR
jgi:hypothetical protein